MFLTGAGQWMEEDPNTFDAGSNPRRYVENDPTNKVDPSGLASEEPIDQGLYKGRIVFEQEGDDKFTYNQERAISRAVRDALARIDVARATLYVTWKEFKNVNPEPSTSINELKMSLNELRKKYKIPNISYTDNVDGYGFSDIPGYGRAYYLVKLRDIRDELESSKGRLRFKPDWKRDPKLLTNAWVDVNDSNKVIHITKRFFDLTKDQRAEKIAHELARRVGFDEQDTGHFLKDADRFDRVLDALEDKHKVYGPQKKK
jgi:hypothetical protein